MKRPLRTPINPFPKHYWPSSVQVYSEIERHEYFFGSVGGSKAAAEFHNRRPAIKQHWKEECLRLWVKYHSLIITYLVFNNQWKGTPKDFALVYNTTWAYLGYIENQDQSAVALATKLKQENIIPTLLLTIRANHVTNTR